MRFPRQLWFWLPVPVLFIGARALELGSCSTGEEPLTEVLTEHIDAEGLVAIGLNAQSSEERGFFVATRGEARCWGLLSREEGSDGLRYLCSDDALSEALVLPESADSRSRQRAASCAEGTLVDCVSLGLSFERGQNGLRLDPGRFMRLFSEACNGGEAVGCLRLARHYTTRTLLPPEPERALELYSLACAQGIAESCASGLMLGAEVLEEIDQRVLRELAERACIQEHADGCSMLGEMREAGMGGEQDSEGSMIAFLQACELGSMVACERLDQEPQ